MIPPHILFDALHAFVLEHLGVDPALPIRRRGVGFDMGRHVFVGLTRELTNGLASYPEIAEAINRRTHSGVHEMNQRWLALPQRVRDAWREEFLEWASKSNHLAATRFDQAHRR